MIEVGDEKNFGSVFTLFSVETRKQPRASNEKQTRSDEYRKPRHTSRGGLKHFETVLIEVI